MIIYIYLVIFRYCLKSKMAAGGHFEKKFWSLFFNATIWFGQFQAKKKIFFLPLKKNKFWDLENFWQFLEKILIFFLRIVKVSLCHLCVLQFEV